MQSQGNLLSAILPDDADPGAYTLTLSGQVVLAGSPCEGSKACTARYVLTRAFDFSLTP
jgi:hypothetical protein